MREVLPNADFADPYTIFNIKRNSYRLITVIHYRYKRVYIKGFMSHAEYPGPRIAYARAYGNSRAPSLNALRMRTKHYSPSTTRMGENGQRIR